MNGKSPYLVMALVAAVAVLATLLAVNLLHDGTRSAFAQSEGVGANYVISMLGQTANDRTPLFVIDTKTQTILVYEYLPSRRQLFLRVARSYAHDRELEDYAAALQSTDINFGLSPRQVQELLRGIRPR